MHDKINSTTQKIYDAFAAVLLEKNYKDVRIQDVLDKSGVARSTFYAHYKTKEDLLKSICSTIFGHVFSHSLEEEKSHDFSKSSMLDYKHFITHIFYHCTTKANCCMQFFSRKARMYSCPICAPN